MTSWYIWSLFFGFYACFDAYIAFYFYTMEYPGNGRVQVLNQFELDLQKITASAFSAY